MISPCTNICKIDSKTKLCIGCKRTLEEIVNWTKYTESERTQIVHDTRNR